MKRDLPAWCSLAIAAAVAVWLLSVPAVAHAQAKGGGGQSSSGSSSSGGSSGSSSGGSGGGHASGGSSGGSGGGHASSGAAGGHVSGGGGSHASGAGSHVGGSATGRSDSGSGSRGAVHGGSPSNAANGSRSGTAVPRSNATSAPNGTATPRGDAGRVAPDPVPPYSRPRGNQPVIGTAVPRPSVPPPNYVVIPGYGYGYYPWGLVGGFGFYGSYHGFYDPWYGGGYSGWDPYTEYTSPQSPSTSDEGAIHLRVRPSSASVYVDGNYAGIVDDFDGTFQKLHISSGTHRIEIRADGYETLTFDVHIEADRAITYKGELKKIQ